MNTTITKAQAEAILDTATELFDLVVAAKQIDEDSPEGQKLYDEIVFGAMDKTCPNLSHAEKMVLFASPG
ncbi:hypothetical protein [Paraburkholderia tropica]|uniref:hypothetical protein n=1 Tax=Paraburkholderia tropica TaxID=92647 RepID=UPI00161774C3|nr:hypothetical protein [Paraburkholderia tropica]MBB2981800.1 hypothetical protein [Paraburkholderia tropica]